MKCLLFAFVVMFSGVDVFAAGSPVSKIPEIEEKRLDSLHWEYHNRADYCVLIDLSFPYPNPNRNWTFTKDDDFVKYLQKFVSDSQKEFINKQDYGQVKSKHRGRRFGERPVFVQLYAVSLEDARIIAKQYIEFNNKSEADKLKANLERIQESLEIKQENKAGLEMRISDYQKKMEESTQILIGLKLSSFLTDDESIKNALYEYSMKLIQTNINIASVSARLKTIGFMDNRTRRSRGDASDGMSEYVSKMRLNEEVQLAGLKAELKEVRAIHDEIKQIINLEANQGVYKSEIEKISRDIKESKHSIGLLNGQLESLKNKTTIPELKSITIYIRENEN